MLEHTYSHGLRSPWNSHLNFSSTIHCLSMTYSEVTVNLFEMKLDKLAQVIKAVEIAERSKYLKAKATKTMAATKPHRVSKSKPQPLRLKKKTAVDKLEYGKRR